VRLDVAHRQSARVQGQDLLVEPPKAALALADDPGLEAAVPVAGSVDRDLPLLGDQGLGRRPVALIACAAGRLLVGFVAEVVGQLNLHRPLHQALGQLGEQPAGPGDLLLRRGASEQLIDHLIADLPVGRHAESLPDSAAATSAIDRVVDVPPRATGVSGGRPARGLPSADLTSLYELARIVAGQPPRHPQLEGLQLPVVLQLGGAPALQRPGLGWHDDLFRSCLHRSSDTPAGRAGRVRWKAAMALRGLSAIVGCWSGPREASADALGADRQQYDDLAVGDAVSHLKRIARPPPKLDVHHIPTCLAPPIQGTIGRTTPNTSKERPAACQLSRTTPPTPARSSRPTAYQSAVAHVGSAARSVCS